MRSLDLIGFPNEYRQFEALASAAITKWAGSATVVCKPLKAGFSGSAVIKIDISKSRDVESGQYILKLSEHPEWPDQEDEISAHRRAERWVVEGYSFSKQHVVSLVHSFNSSDPDVSGYAMLFEIAGYSLDSFIPTDSKESAGFSATCMQLTTDMLNGWVKPEPDSEEKYVAQLLSEWLGYRLHEGSELRSFVSSHTKDSRFWIVGSESVANPIAFFDFAKSRNVSPRLTFSGLLHGDLHGGNILVHSRDPKNQPYWLIDFGHSKCGPAGYDQAYLEVARVLYALKEEDPRLLINALQVLDETRKDYLAPHGTMLLIDDLSKQRKAIVEWRDRIHKRRADEIDRQFLLAQIAAGLNWANKTLLDANARLIALCYSSWAASAYLRKYELIGEFTGTQSPTLASAKLAVPDNVPKSPDSKASDAIWHTIWSEAKSFSDPNVRYILIAGGIRNIEFVGALGKIPWSAIIDLDPYSDVDGLYKQMANVLDELRKIHPLSNADDLSVDFNRSTAWVFSCGWALKNEDPTTFQDWKYNRLPQLRSLFRAFDKETNPSPAIAVVLTGESLDSDKPMHRISYACDALLESTKGRARILLLDNASFEQPIDHVSLPLGARDFIVRLSDSFGSSSSKSVPQLPSKKSFAGSDLIADLSIVPLDLQLTDLRALEENFHILHSRILDSDANYDMDAFWRGKQPSWSDLFRRADIPRSIQNDLLQELDERLSKFGSHTVLLEHPPGTGGSTLAYRVAWELRLSYPTAILHTWSEEIASRLAKLYHLTQLPVLLVADSSDLTESAREDLYREIRQRNISVILLFTRRGFTASSNFRLSAEMDEAESGKFLESFSKLVPKGSSQAKHLKELTSDQKLARYRTPFYYGLVTFERDFAGIDKFVSHHLRGLRGQTKDILQYIALMTIYSQSWLNEVLVKRLVGIPDDSKVELEDVFGPAERLLIRHDGSIRVMHQLVAEEVLSNISGSKRPDEWKLDLFTIATRFIEDVSRVADPESEPVEHMLRQLFTERHGRGVDDSTDRKDFSRLVEDLDLIDNSHGHNVLRKLVDCFPLGAHYYNHLGRHQIYRMEGRDIGRAAEYLEKAVQLGAGDFIHHHTLGLARRSQVKRLIDEMATDNASEFLTAIEPHFHRAVQAFEVTRTLKPQNMYGYVTQVQMILEVAGKLNRISGKDSIASLANESENWIRDNIWIASSLLEEARQLYGTLDQQDSYLDSCTADLARLYNNLDKAIRTWEIAVDRNPTNLGGRRQLAYAYVSRGKSSFRNLGDNELRRIKDLMEKNLRAEGRREDDFKLWFEAYRALPEFDVEEALANLKVWGARFESWRACFYEYAIHFYLWFSGRSNSINEMRNAIDDCSRLYVGRRNQSHLWFASSPETFPFASSSDLGSWNKLKGFWNEVGILERVNGIIEPGIKGPQAGAILIGNSERVFFVPGKYFTDDNANDPVNFFLGLSPSGGLRAWDVKPDHSGKNRMITEKPRVKMVSTGGHLEIPSSRRAVAHHVDAEIQKFIEDLIVVKQSLGADVVLDELANRVKAAFGNLNMDSKYTAEGIRVSLAKSGDYKFDVEDGAILVRSKTRRKESTKPLESETIRDMHGTVTKWTTDKIPWGFVTSADGSGYYFTVKNVLEIDRSRVSNGKSVSFIPGSNDRGLSAKGVHILTGEELMAVVKVIIAETVRDESIGYSELHHQINSHFRTTTKNLCAQLGVQNLYAVLNEMPEIVIQGDFPEQVVLRVGAKPPFDFIPPTSPVKPTTTDTLISDSNIAWEQGIVTFWNSSYGKVMTKRGREFRFNEEHFTPKDRIVELRRGIEVEIVSGSEGTLEWIRLG